MNAESDLNRLRWQCRRGMLELDLLLLRVLDELYPDFDPALRSDFQRLLEYPDQTLQRWLLGDEREVEQNMVRIVEVITQRIGTDAAPG